MSSYRGFLIEELLLSLSVKAWKPKGHGSSVNQEMTVRWCPRNIVFRHFLCYLLIKQTGFGGLRGSSKRLRPEGAKQKVGKPFDA